MFISNRKTSRVMSLMMALLLIVTPFIMALPAPAMAEVTVPANVFGIVYEDATGVFKIAGDGFRPGDSFDLTKITLSDRSPDGTKVNTYQFNAGDATIQIESTSEAKLTLTDAGLANLCSQIPRIYDGEGDGTVDLSFASGWYLRGGQAESEEPLVITVLVEEAYPVGPVIDRVKYHSDKGVFIFQGTNFRTEDRIDVSCLSIYDTEAGTDVGYSLVPSDATAQINSDSVFVVTLTSTGKANLMAAIPSLNGDVSVSSVIVRAERDYYRGANGEYRNEEETGIEVSISILPGQNFTDSDLDKVYYYRTPESGLPSDNITFELTNLPPNLIDLHVKFGYLEDDVFTESAVILGGEDGVVGEPLFAESENNGTYLFNTPITNGDNNNNFPLAIQVSDGIDVVGEPFELVTADERSVYVNILPPEITLQPDSETTDFTQPGIDLSNVSNFTLDNPGYAKVVFRQPLNFVDHIQDLINMGDDLYLESHEFAGLKCNGELFDNVPVTVYMEQIALSSVPKIRTLLDPGFPSETDAVETGEVYNISYDAETKILSFDAIQTNLFEPYFPVFAEFEDIDADQGEVGGLITWETAHVASNVTGFDAYYLDADGNPNDPIGDTISINEENAYAIDIPEDTQLNADMKQIGIFEVLLDEWDLKEVAKLTIIDNIQMSSGTNSVTIDANTTTGTTIRVPVGVYNANVNVGTLVQPNGDKVEATLNYPLNAQIDTTTNESIALEVPANVTISAPSGWTGEINLPTILPNTQVNVDGTVATVIEVGYGDVPLTLSKAAKLVFPGQAGKKVGFQRGDQFTEITQVLEHNTQEWADGNIGLGGDAKVEVDEDLIVWTKHFTKFATYTTTNSVDNGGGSSGSLNTTPTVPVVTPQQQAKTFGDLAKHWAAADIQVLVNKGLVQGKSDNVFAPDQNITRAELVAILVRGLGLKTASTQQLPKDVQPNAWYAQSINAAVEAGLITGFADGNIRPQANVTREELAVILARATKMLNLTVPQGAEQSVTFVDANNISSWARTSVESAVAAELIKGNTAGSFLPGKTTSRAEAAVMIKRLLEKGSLI